MYAHVCMVHTFTLQAEWNVAYFRVSERVSSYYLTTSDVIIFIGRVKVVVINIEFHKSVENLLIVRNWG